jgi:hypothetical protein
VAGGCDVAETCTGSANACPNDTVIGAGTTCRPAVSGGCDLAETCNGTNACPSDAVVTSGTVCRASTATCDGAETCNGSNVCPADTNFSPNTTQCYTTQGICDNGSFNCTGTSNACPAATYKSGATVCRPAAGACDVAENCTGGSSACPGDILAGNGTLCRGQLNICDATETCNGASSACPTDGFAAMNTDCGYTGGPNALSIYTTGLVTGANANVLDFPTSPTTGYTNSFTNAAAVALVAPAVLPGWGSDAMKFTVTAPATAAVDYWRWIAGNGTGSGVSRALQAADFIEYDVYLDANIDGIGGIDIKTNKADTAVTGCGGSCSYFRGWTSWADQNGLGGHPGTNLVSPTNRAYQKWYHRRLAVPAGLVGNTITYFDVVDEHGVLRQPGHLADARRMQRRGGGVFGETRRRVHQLSAVHQWQLHSERMLCMCGLRHRRHLLRRGHHQPRQQLPALSNRNEQERLVARAQRHELQRQQPLHVLGHVHRGQLRRHRDHVHHHDVSNADLQRFGQLHGRQRRQRQRLHRRRQRVHHRHLQRQWHLLAPRRQRRHHLSRGGRRL